MPSVDLRMLELTLGRILIRISLMFFKKKPIPSKKGKRNEINNNS